MEAAFNGLGEIMDASYLNGERSVLAVIAKRELEDLYDKEDAGSKEANDFQNKIFNAAKQFAAHMPKDQQQQYKSFLFDLESELSHLENLGIDWGYHRGFVAGYRLAKG
ncbi:hypothetical protein PA598K_06888 [Paenibacillus sp. 598K]|uniref:hypothetical protein n=1 Tax=Paenibacillus sp. 598K TaxID=1117987 RepID=UPI000FFADAF3|nr:hypothetical protein [Paenibacillus sp. 598K]GBF78270.1 hypothetical protein PA598K_06888 [Paenibacillus sp. 598K]